MPFHPEPGLEVAGRYRLVRRVGGGVFGVLWEGESLDDGSIVLLEMLRGEGFGQAAVSHVWRAAMLVERCGHPGAIGITDVVGAGTDEDVVAIAVVPFTPGAELDLWLQLEPRSLVEAVSVIREVVDILESAHASIDIKGRADPLVHLGLKPTEVVVGEQTYDGPRRGRMRVRILDFGLARDHVEEDEFGTIASISSPRFSSPESFSNPDFEGPWSDVWSVGVMLYSMASGSYPFLSDSDSTPFQIQKHILDKPSIPLHVLDERIPRAFSELVERCLAKNPSERFEDARELARAFDELPELDPSLPAHPFPTSARAKPRAGERLLSSMDPIPASPTASRRPPPHKHDGRRAGIVAASLVALGATVGIAVVGSNGLPGDFLGLGAKSAPVSASLVGSPTADHARITTTIDPYAELIASNPFRSVPAPAAAQPLGCESDPATTNIEIEASVAQVPLRAATVSRGVLAGLARTSVCDSNERRDSSGHCMVLGCPSYATGPDDSGRCTATRTVRGPIQRCYRRAAAKFSMTGQSGVMLQEHEVTWAELGRFVSSRNRPVFIGVDPDNGALRNGTWSGEVREARANLPAQGVPRALAIAYCSAIGARLPTEVEFETAARGRSFASAPWGHAAIDFGAQLHSLGAPGVDPHPVRERSSLDRTIADYPIFDLVGNVREWTSDPYRPDSPAGSPSNALPENLESGLGYAYGVVRGLPLSAPKGWPRLSRIEDLESLLPVPAAYRAPMCADTQSSLERPGGCVSGTHAYLSSLQDVGFRCARAVP